MTPIPFWKMSGCGNDFILIDNRENVLPMADPARFCAAVCRRKMSVGADGLILIEGSEHADFSWRFYNSDGSVAEMCGNGARCAARFAFLNGIAGERIRFETLAGLISAEVHGDAVKIRMTPPRDLLLNASLEIDSRKIEYHSVNTGVPHVVIFSDDIENAPVRVLGSQFRYHDLFAPAGTNVNFIAPLGERRWAIRTYERGVEDETLACGTGNVAAALILAARKMAASPATFQARSGGILKVYFQETDQGFDEIHLEGDARIIYQARLDPDAWQTDS